MGYRISGGIARKDTCISPESDRFSAQEYPGPRCIASDTDWMEGMDDTEYEYQTAKDKCEMVNHKVPHYCTGINKEPDGWTLRSGDEKWLGAGFMAAECQDWRHVEPEWECADYARNDKVGCKWERWERHETPAVLNESWVGEGDPFVHDEHGDGNTSVANASKAAPASPAPAPAFTPFPAVDENKCFTLEEAKRKCEVLPACHGVQMHPYHKTHPPPGCHGDVMWSLRTGREPTPGRSAYKYGQYDLIFFFVCSNAIYQS